MTIDSPYIVTISGLTITGGLACSSSGCVGRGGGIANLGTLSLSNSTVRSNSATVCSASGCSGKGGGIYNDSGSAAVTLTNDTITDNVASSIGYGGGIYNNSGSPTLKNDTIKNNSPDQCAGTNINC